MSHGGNSFSSAGVYVYANYGNIPTSPMPHVLGAGTGGMAESWDIGV
jgi:hypothetical protein